MIGPYPDWDMGRLKQTMTFIKLWEAADKDALLARSAHNVRAIATRGDLGAKRSH